MSTHRTLDGLWAECDDSSCQLLFHFPGMTVTELQETPLRLLLPMLNLMQPPSGHTPGGMLVWRKEIPDWHMPVIHRDYDLPAVMKPNGSLDWRFEGFLHRAGAPAEITVGGIQRWWHMGEPKHYSHRRLDAQLRPVLD